MFGDIGLKCFLDLALSLRERKVPFEIPTLGIGIRESYFRLSQAMKIDQFAVNIFLM